MGKILKNKIEWKRNKKLYNISNIKQYNEGRIELKNIFEIIVKKILGNYTSLIREENSYFDQSYEKKIKDEEYNDINIVNGYDIRVMILVSDIYLNVDKKTKISSRLNCL